MKIYRYWSIESAVWPFEGEDQRFTSYGRSNLSSEDAKRDGAERLERVRLKLAGEPVTPRQDYAVDIREEIVHERDTLNAITRNRYGALVWNTMQYTILDIDAAEHSVSLLESLGFKKMRDPKAVVMDELQELVTRSEYRDLAFRIYETVQGYRVLVLGRYFEPGSPAFRNLIRHTQTDGLYAEICIKQQCYRARLTPKPYRIGVERIRYRWPMPTDVYAEAQTWVRAYEAASASFATCRYVTTLGAALSTPDLSFHDEPTGALTGKPLA